MHNTYLRKLNYRQRVIQHGDDYSPLQLCVGRTSSDIPLLSRKWETSPSLAVTEDS